MKLQMRLLGYVRPQWRGLATVLGTTMLASVLDVLRPWPVKILMDQILFKYPMPAALGRFFAVLPGAEGTDGLLAWICIGTVVIFVSRTLLGMVITNASLELGLRMAYNLGADLFRHLQKLSLIFHRRRPVGDLVGRVTVDTYCVQVLVVSALLPLLEAGLMLSAMCVIMWNVEPSLTLLALGVVPFMVLLMWLFGKPMKETSRMERDIEGTMMSLVEQTLGAIPAVQAFTREEIESDRFRRYADECLEAYRKSTAVALWFKLFIGLVTAVGAAAIMWLGTRYALQGKVTVGSIILFLSYLESLYEPLNSVVQSTSLVQHSAASADRVMEIFDTPLDVREQPGALAVPLRGHVRYESVTFGYEPDRPVLKSISLEARPGEVVAIVGPTGAGKTTLVNLLVRFFDPWTGRVTVDGHEIGHLRLASLRQQVALVLQDPYIFPLTVAENIAYGRPAATREEIVAAAVAANADDFIQRLPEKYDSVIGERGTTLSGGEKQRLSIARAFLKDAPILILDEPTSALDARTERLLLDALDRLEAGRTTFIIAHRLSTIRNADRILVLDRGEIVEQGCHEDLMASGGLYASLYRQQMEIVRHDTPAETSEEGAEGGAGALGLDESFAV